MTTAQNLIDNVRSGLLAGMAEQRNQLLADYVAGSGTLSLKQSATGIGPNTRVSIGQSVFHVWSVTPGGVATVQAGEDGSPDANYPANSMVRVNPRFTDYRILQEVNADIVELSGEGLYQMKPFEFTYNSAFDAFDLTTATDLQQEYEVFYQEPGARRDWMRLSKLKWRVERLANTVDFPSGFALRLFHRLHNGYKVRLLYKAPFTQLASATADMATTGLPVTAYTLPELGAYVSLAWSRETKRNMGEAQPEPRRQEQIPAGGMLRSPQGVLQVRTRRINAERARLHEQWPTRA